MIDNTKMMMRSLVAKFSISAPIAKTPFMTLRVYDDATVSGDYETMPCEQIAQVMQIGNTILSQARSSQMVLQARTPFVKKDVPEMQVKFIKAMVKEIADASQCTWEIEEAF